ncbi:hypothetical protein [Paraburkholderia sp. BR10882]|uniref:hypothetical protein n=1 Tax=unclassified Paraburkholderia TaxID=2615204 RepID=UPI0034CEF541
MFDAEPDEGRIEPLQFGHGAAQRFGVETERVAEKRIARLVEAARVADRALEFALTGEAGQIDASRERNEERLQRHPGWRCVRVSHAATASAVATREHALEALDAVAQPPERVDQVADQLRALVPRRGAQRGDRGREAVRTGRRGYATHLRYRYCRCCAYEAPTTRQFLPPSAGWSFDVFYRIHRFGDGAHESRGARVPVAPRRMN